MTDYKNVQDLPDDIRIHVYRILNELNLRIRKGKDGGWSSRLEMDGEVFDVSPHPLDRVDSTVEVSLIRVLDSEAELRTKITGVMRIEAEWTFVGHSIGPEDIRQLWVRVEG